MKIFRCLFYPKPLQTFFNAMRCPTCGEQKWNERQDGGHDSLMICGSCHSEFGINWAPFNTIERIR